MSASALHWHTVRPDALAWQDLDGELAVHNADSGSTHLLEPLSGEVLRILIEAGCSMSVPQLVARLRQDSTVEDISEWSAAVEAVLCEFKRLGLAESEQP